MEGGSYIQASLIFRSLLQVALFRRMLGAQCLTVAMLNGGIISVLRRNTKLTRVLAANFNSMEPTAVVLRA
jgi:hypothetical protein